MGKPRFARGGRATTIGHGQPKRLPMAPGVIGYGQAKVAAVTPWHPGSISAEQQRRPCPGFIEPSLPWLRVLHTMLAMPDSLTILAPAKLNLALSVGTPAHSGMHPICSWMVTIDLHDEMALHRLPHDRLSRYAIVWHNRAKAASDIDWPLRRDLAVRAHHALEQQVGRTLPVQMKLTKRIPVGAGLGGGSSDAAAMLRGLNDLFELGLAASKLEFIAARLGSDVPFFLRGGSAIVEGMGEELVHHDSPRAVDAVLVMPRYACPTGEVYRAYDLLGPRELRRVQVAALAGAERLDPEAPFNDLAAAAMSVASELRGHMEAAGALAERPAHLTGSGSAFFIVCDDPMHAAALAEAIESRLQLPTIAVRTALASSR